MTQPSNGGMVSSRVAEAMAQFEEERRKLADLQSSLSSTTTTVRARDRLFTVTLDGRGEVTSITFDGFRYRKLAPAELARLIVETIATGRRQAIDKLGAMVGSDPLPGVSFSELATGSRPFTEVLDSFLGAALDTLPERIRGRVEQRMKGEY